MAAQKNGEAQDLLIVGCRKVMWRQSGRCWSNSTDIQ